jgi:hypothetical protein
MIFEVCMCALIGFDVREQTLQHFYELQLIQHLIVDDLEFHVKLVNSFSKTLKCENF